MKNLILLDESVSIPLLLGDKSHPEGKSVLNPTGEVNNQLAEKLVGTYPLKYAIYDETNAEHKRLVEEGKFPEAKKIIVDELEANFKPLSREEKQEVIEFIKKLKTGKTGKGKATKETKSDK